MAGFLTTLHEAGCNVLAFDFRGHGDSPGHTASFGSKDVDDLQDAVAYLQARFPDKPVLLVGVSYGAAISLEALQRLPEVQGVWSEGSFRWLSHAVRRRLDCVPAVLLKPLVRMYYVLGKLDSGLWVPEVNPVHCLDGVRVPSSSATANKTNSHRSATRLPFMIATKARNRAIGLRAAHVDLRQRHRDEYLARLALHRELHRRENRR